MFSSQNNAQMPYDDPSSKSGVLLSVSPESSFHHRRQQRRRHNRRSLAATSGGGGGRLSVTFQRNLAPPSAFDYDLAGTKTYVIWGVHSAVPVCLDESTPGGLCGSVGNYLQHDKGDYGAVIVNLQCVQESDCVLSEDPQFQPWEVVALAWFAGVVALGVLGRGLRGRSQTCAPPLVFPPLLPFA